MSQKNNGVSRRMFLGVSLGAGVLGTGVACSEDKKDCADSDSDSGTGHGSGSDSATDVAEEIQFVYPDQDNSEVRWGFLIDLERCTGCKACAVACKTEYDVPLGYFRNGVRELEEGTYPTVSRDYVPWLCNHCKNPICITLCPVEPIKAELTFPSGATAEFWAKATYQRPDGLVQIDADRCIGCGSCVKSCPYGARYLNPGRDAGGDPVAAGLNIDSPKAADKCSMCIHRMENGVVPACVNTCPANARLVGNLNDPTSDISKALAAAGTNVSVLLENMGTEPQVYYIGLNDNAYSAGTEPKLEAGLQQVTPDFNN